MMLLPASACRNPYLFMVVRFRNLASFILAENSQAQRLCGAYDSFMSVTNPEQHRLLGENNFVPVLEYTDEPGVQTTPHQHPNSVMVTLSAFDRRLSAGDRVVDVSSLQTQPCGYPHSGIPVSTSVAHQPTPFSSS